MTSLIAQGFNGYIPSTRPYLDVTITKKTYFRCWIIRSMTIPRYGLWENVKGCLMRKKCSDDGPMFIRATFIWVIVELATTPGYTILYVHWPVFGVQTLPPDVGQHVHHSIIWLLECCYSCNNICSHETQHQILKCNKASWKLEH